MLPRAPGLIVKKDYQWAVTARAVEPHIRRRCRLATGLLRHLHSGFITMQLALGGVVLGAALGFVFTQGTMPAMSSIVVSLLLGLAFSCISFFVYKVGVFLYVGTGTFIVGSLIGYDSGAVIIVSLALAISAVLLVRPVIIVYTGLAGGLLAGGASRLLQGSVHWSRVGLPSAMLICAGILFQFWNTKMRSRARVTEKGVSYFLPLATMHDVIFVIILYVTK